MADTITAKFRCPKCNGRIVWEEDAADTDNARCEGCGEEIVDVGALKKRAMAEAQKHATDVVRSAFKGSGFKLN